MLRGRTIVVGVSGGIAAYKACELVRSLRTREAAVIVVMSAAAREFVTPLTFQTLSGNPVVQELWGDQNPGFHVADESARRIRGKVEHVDVAEAADAMVIAPATADVMARMVHGQAPDALTCVALACRAPLVVCPAMDAEMWRNAATRANVQALRNRGAIIVGPETGALASGLEGPGRLADLATILEAVEHAVARRTSLEGVRVLVGAGRTEEAIDPVRVLTNRSSGRMGYAVAEAARDRGATVTLVTGPASVDPPEGVELERVTSAAEMEAAMLHSAAKADMVVMVAAVADYRPAKVAHDKIKRREESLTLSLEPTTDILARVGGLRRKGQVVAGFALESSRGIESARRKLAEKRVDLIVLNTPADGIGGDSNRVTFVEAKGALKLPLLPKREVAERLLDRLVALRGRHTPAQPAKPARSTAVSRRPRSKATPRRARPKTASRRARSAR